MAGLATVNALIRERDINARLTAALAERDAEIARLRALLVEAMGALEPFADVGSLLRERTIDTDLCSTTFPAKKFRTAAATLAKIAEAVKTPGMA